MNKRIIAKIDIKGPHVVKGVHLEGLRVLGKPENFVEYYYNNDIDELYINDVVASLFQRNSQFDLIKKITRNAFVPVILGGGIRTLDDIQLALKSGADKVCINTHATKDIQFIKDAIQRFGASTIIVGIDAKMINPNYYLAYTDYGREKTDLNVKEWTEYLSNLGVGELIVNSIDRDGTGKGFDINLIEQLSKSIRVPLIVAGGAGKLEHISEVTQIEGVDAIVLSSVLHYEAINHFKLNEDDYTQEGNIDFLLSQEKYSIISPLTIKDVKNAMAP